MNLFSNFLFVFVLLVPGTLQFANQPESVNHKYRPRFTIAQLTNTHYPSPVSSDVNLNSWKSGIKMKNGSNIVVTEELHPNRITFEDHGSRSKRAAIAMKEKLWDFGVIPYEIDSQFSGSQKALFMRAMRHWENFTCLKFVERSSEYANYIIFTVKSCGCCSSVGKEGNGGQTISIGKNCDYFGIVVHELGHAIGFWHEQSRPDRDKYVQILEENIKDKHKHNFKKHSKDEVNSLGLPYDYESIMHYSTGDFSKGANLSTIYPIKNASNLKIGQRVKLSAGDIAQTNLLYECPKCGRTFQESSGNFSNYLINVNGSLKCEWRITAARGERIKLNITDLNVFKSDECISDYLEVTDGYWHKSKLIRKFCGNERTGQIIMSSGNRMLITHLISEKRSKTKIGFSAEYETVCGGNIFIDKENGYLESPGYPDDYQPSKKCIWRLTAPKNFRVALEFQLFEIEKQNKCTSDYVAIRDGHSADSPLIGIYCGSKLPPNIRSTKHKLYIKFVSNRNKQMAGFSARYSYEK